MEQATILLTDDDRLILFSLAKGLRNAGFTVLEADSGENAIRVCENYTPDLVILDMRMGGISGMEVAEWLNIHKPTPFLFLSAYDDHETVHAASQAGALGYLIKPIEVSQLIPSIHTALIRSKEIARLETSCKQLSDTLNCSREISVAIGILMERLQLGQKEAFDHLRLLSRNQRRKTLEIAIEIINGGTIH